MPLEKSKTALVKITPVKEKPFSISSENAFTPITKENAQIEEFRRLCSSYGVAQYLEKGCAFCILQIRCLNVIRLGIPVEIEHFRHEHFQGNPFLSEATDSITDENIELVLQYALEDIGVYQEEGDSLNQDRVLKLLKIHSKGVLKSIDPRIPVLLFDRLQRNPELVEGLNESGETVYELKSNLPF